MQFIALSSAKRIRAAYIFLLPGSRGSDDCQPSAQFVDSADPFLAAVALSFVCRHLLGFCGSLSPSSTLDFTVPFDRLVRGTLGLKKPLVDITRKCLDFCLSGCVLLFCFSTDSSLYSDFDSELADCNHPGLLLSREILRICLLLRQGHPAVRHLHPF